MSNLLSWIYQKLKQRERKRHSKLAEKFLSPLKISDLEKILGIEVKNKSFYVRALMHRSYLEQLDHHDDSNERLEFLGDAVLNLIVAEYLFEHFPEKDEGFLTKARAKLVNRVALSDSAEEIGLQNFVLISRNLSSKFNSASKTVLSDAFEALIGAIYLDHKLHTCKEFLLRVLIEPNIKDGEFLIDENYKSQLLEYAQAHKYDVPVYTVINEEGPQHERIFTIKASVGTKFSGIGKGRNKKTAEQRAAKDALSKISDNNFFNKLK